MLQCLPHLRLTHRALEPPGFLAPKQSHTERIYFQAWNVGKTCGSGSIPGCRAAATSYLTNSSGFAFQTDSVAVFVTIGLSGPDGEPVDLTKLNVLAGKGYIRRSTACATPTSSSTQKASPSRCVLASRQFSKAAAAWIRRTR